MTNKTLACRSGKKGHGQDERRQNTSSQRSPTPDASSDVRCTNFTIVYKGAPVHRRMSTPIFGSVSCIGLKFTWICTHTHGFFFTITIEVFQLLFSLFALQHKAGVPYWDHFQLNASLIRGGIGLLRVCVSQGILKPWKT